VNSSTVRKQLYAYLDESGDLGFGQGGTERFTIAFVTAEHNNTYFVQVFVTQKGKPNASS
jgi:hypothetical protein